VIDLFGIAPDVIMRIDGYQFTGVGFELIHTGNHVIDGLGHMQVIIFNVIPKISATSFNFLVNTFHGPTISGTVCHRNEFCGKTAMADDLLDVSDSFWSGVVV
jgi:hypothetical protein